MCMVTIMCSIVDRDYSKIMLTSSAYHMPLVMHIMHSGKDLSDRESFSCPFPFSIVYLQLEDNSVLINADYSHLFGASDISGNNGCFS